jgi:endonuclease III
VSRLTAKLLHVALPRKSRAERWMAVLDQVTDRLVAAYGTPSLGNLRDPVDEIIYILLSARTAEVKYSRSYAALRSRYPRIADLATTSVEDIYACIEDGGLANKRAAQVKGIAAKLTRVLGDNPSRRLRGMPAEEVFSFLRGLPGVAEKSALCVMMYSLGWDVFPVDVNARRIATRLGLLQDRLDHRGAQARLPPFVPEGRSKELHVGFIVHGREVCKPIKPSCISCILKDLCKFGQSQARKRRE